jgi:ABC-2 type transport system permease protein
VTALLKAELLKLRTTRTFVALMASALGLSLLVVVLSALLQDEWSEADVRELFTADFSGLFILLLGVIGMTGEWRHRTITGTILAAPDRLRLLAAKLVAYAGAGIVVSLVVTVTIMAVGTLILDARDQATLDIGDLADVLWRNLVVAGLFGAFGVCIGTLVRNQIVAVIGVLIVAFVAEPTLLSLVPEVGRFGPTGGAPNAIIGINPFNDEELLSPGIAILVMLGWIGVGFGLGGALLRRRDVNT